MVKERIQKYTKILLEDYKRGRDIDEIDTFTPPDKERIVKILLQLQNLIFPGYFKNATHHSYTVEGNLTVQLEDLVYHLSKQISLVLKYLPEYADREGCDLVRVGEEYALRLVDRLPAIRALMNTDLDAAYNGDPAAFNKSEIILSYPGLFAIMVNRIAHELYEMQIPLLPRMMTEYAHACTGIDIHPGAKLGSYFFIDHGTGIVIGETAVIGDHVKIYQGVTIGALSTRDGQSLHGKKRHPTLESRVTVYANASILGGDTVIGEGAVIGGNAFITSSVAPGTKVSIKNPEHNFKVGK